jgi:hypothetical protein
MPLFKTTICLELADPDGTIARKLEGYLDAAALREALETLIDGRKAS